MNSQFVRLTDCCLAFSGLILFSPVLVIVFAIGLLDTGSPIFVQVRVGRAMQPFKLFKFRTMAISTESVATHLVRVQSVTKVGAFLRKTKLDELPQLVNVLKGDMSLVGPRPCLFNQEELLAERSKRAVFSVRPGITGLAQVNGVDMSMPERLAEWDEKMIEQFDLRLYFHLIARTLFGAGSGDRVLPSGSERREG